jgi:aldehyde:ferredoxin oxidoreductase
MAHGYAGRILFVDLSAGVVTEEVPDELFYRTCVGGTGMGAKMTWERTRPGIDPLGPENLLTFATGPFSATGVYGGGRFMVTGKSPLTQGWADSNSGGTWGPQLKRAGYDALFVSGAADSPVGLVIDAGKPRLMAAAHLWGKDTYETDDLLRAELGDPKSWTVSCIGPAGERCSRIAGIVNEKGRIAARSGLGAVMGSKRLKAIAVRAAKGSRIRVADKDGLLAAQADYLAIIQESRFLTKLGTAGTAADTSFLLSLGDSPCGNWSATGADAFPTAGNLDGPKMDVYKLRGYGCSACPVRCGALVRIADGPYAMESESHRPEYETMAALGTNCRNDDVRAVIHANDICNRFGIDTVAVGGAIAFAMECYENGIVTAKDTGGLELTWGNAGAVVALTEQMARGEGFGAVLVDGCRQAAERIGRGAEEFAMHVGGRELPLHDPRFGPARGVFYTADATPANHCGPQGMAILDQGKALGTDPLLQSNSPGVFLGYEAKGDIYARGAAYWQLMSSAGLCSLFSTFDRIPVVELLRPVTGWDIGWSEGLTIGRRILTWRQAFNAREGLTPDDYRLPTRFLEALSAGPAAGQAVPFELLRKNYFLAMGWDPTSGEPHPETLASLGIGRGASSE